MADQSDVETELAKLVATVLYPQGTAQSSLVGAVCRVYRGWPNAAALDADLAAKVVNVTIFPESGRQTNTTRYPAAFAVTVPVTPTLTVATSGTTATFGGTAGAGQIAGVLADGLAAVHRTVAGDTPALVAAILAAELRATHLVQTSGASLTVPGARLVVARVVADQPALEETRRQQQAFRVTAWCPDPATRDAVASAIDGALSAVTFLTLADGTGGRLRFLSSTSLDQNQDAALYRRDLIYSVEYATTIAADLPCLLFGNTTLAPDGAGVIESLLG